MWKAEPAPRSGRPPLTIVAAMGIAIGGAVVSAAFDLWLVVLNPPYFGALSQLYLVLNLVRVALNVGFLVGMWHQAVWAWRAAFTLVVIGAIVDMFGFVLPFTLVFPDYGFLYIGGILAVDADSLTVLTIGAWVHLVVIQVPILALLWRTSSRRWVGIGTSTEGIHDGMQRS